MQSLRAATDPALEQAPQGIRAQGGETVDLLFSIYVTLNVTVTGVIFPLKIPITIVP